ncbi:MAG: DNA-directed RNA polymerase II subunit [Caeruleum heppii]|nr:MAG: DNA-directed RNA polymerase II subunit [Caeruleum heppii]
MFFLYDLSRTITLHPSFFGPRIREYLMNKLLEDVEGTCTGRYFIICVVDAHDISEGRIVPGSAVAEFTVSYRAVVWRPFKGETVRLPYVATRRKDRKVSELGDDLPALKQWLTVMVDAVVSSVNRMGFFADVGPLEVFVTSHLIPSDIKFDANATPPQYTDNGDQVIEKGTHVRIKLVGTRSDVGNMFAIGSVKEDFLGTLS